MSFFPPHSSLLQGLQTARRRESFNLTVEVSQDYLTGKNTHSQIVLSRGNATLVLSSASRIDGTIGNAVYLLPRPCIAYAASMKSLTFPVSWPNVLSVVYFSVIYDPPAQPYVGDIAVVPDNYTYNLYQGQVMLAQVNAQSIYVNADELVWYVLREFKKKHLKSWWHSITCPNPRYWIDRNTIDY